MLLRLAKGLRMDDDLMPGIDGSHAVIALNHAVAGLHLGAVVVGDVALARLAGLARFVVVVIEPGLELLH